MAIPGIWRDVAREGAKLNRCVARANVPAKWQKGDVSRSMAWAQLAIGRGGLIAVASDGVYSYFAIGDHRL